MGDKCQYCGAPLGIDAIYCDSLELWFCDYRCKHNYIDQYDGRPEDHDGR